MTPLVALGARLVRAGGALRVWSVVGGCAVAVAVLATAWALPDALYPVTDPMSVDPRRGPFVSLTQGLAVPVLALVMTVGRLSSQVRDRRLASLRLLGVPRRATTVAALVENLLPATVGAALGIGAGLAARPVLTSLLAGDLQAPITLPPARLAAVAVGVIALSGALALAPLRRLGAEPRAEHAESVLRRPSTWRLAPVVPAVGAFAYLLTRAPGSTDAAVTPVFLGGVLTGAFAVALATPLVTSLVAGRLVASPRLTALLAGRGMQTQPVSIGRRVTALGLTVYVVVGGAGMLGIFEGTTHIAAAIRQVEQGPQVMFVGAYDDLPPGLLAEIEQVDGVHTAIPQYGVVPEGCDGAAFTPVCAVDVVVATCDQLSALMAADGCRDDEPAWITSDIAGYESIVAPSSDPMTSLALVDQDGRDLGVLDLTGSITQDVPATAATWTWPASYDVFVPLAVAEHWGAQARSAVVVTDAGADVRAAVAAAAERHGGYADNPYLADYAQVVSTRVAAWTVMAVGIGVALLAHGLATVDRARELRRPRARLVALGVPARLLRRVGVTQCLAPLLTATTLAAGLGAGATAALSHYADQGFAIAPRVAAVLLGATAVGAIVVSTAAAPLIRARVRAEDLRSE